MAYILKQELNCKVCMVGQQYPAMVSYYYHRCCIYGS